MYVTLQDRLLPHRSTTAQAQHGLKWHSTSEEMVQHSLKWHSSEEEEWQQSKGCLTSAEHDTAWYSIVQLDRDDTALRRMTVIVD